MHRARGGGGRADRRGRGRPARPRGPGRPPVPRRAAGVADRPDRLLRHRPRGRAGRLRPAVADRAARAPRRRAHAGDRHGGRPLHRGRRDRRRRDAPPSPALGCSRPRSTRSLPGAPAATAWTSGSDTSTIRSPADVAGTVDVVTAVVPYVPSEELRLLPRDVREHEPRAALDGGPGGTGLLLEVVARAPRLLGPDGWLLLELGGDQDEAVGRKRCGNGDSPGSRPCAMRRATRAGSPRSDANRAA